MLVKQKGEQSTAIARGDFGGVRVAKSLLGLVNRLGIGVVEARNAGQGPLKYIKGPGPD